MGWLRRIPAETRIVVLVVFLALFQALLLSIFGLKAIQGERRQAEDRLAIDAAHFLERSVAGLLVQRIGHATNEAVNAAFVDGNRDALGPLFSAAWWVTPEGEIFEPGPGGAPVRRSREAVRADAAVARTAAAEFQRRYRQGEIEEEAFPAASIAFARAHPFAIDANGSSLALAFASAPLFGGEAPAPQDLLLDAHWIGLLVEAAQFVPARETSAFLKLVRKQLGEDAAPALVQQANRMKSLRALEAERPYFDAATGAAMHQNIRADEAHRFYVRAKEDGSSRVLVVRPAELTAMLNGVVAAAAGQAERWVTPQILRDGKQRDDDIVFPLTVLPGYVAAASITPELVAEEAMEGESIYRWIIAFSVLGILAGGFLTSRVVMREVRVAKLKSGFVSNVTHELKTPLTSIRMFSDMLRDGQVKDEAEQKQCLEVIGQETERLGGLIQKVLDFGRSDSPRPRYRWQTASIAPVIEKEVARLCRSTGLTEIDLDVAENLPPVVHDPDAFTDVVANLLSNAYKYSPPDNREISVTLLSSRGRVLLSVEDNGAGIPPRERRKVFEQFYRADDLLTRGVEGTGLGLSIARNIVRAHGGKIGVEDSKSGGSRFFVDLPAASRRAKSEPNT